MTVVSPVWRCDGESHAAVQKAVTVNDRDELRGGLMATGRCATLILTLFDSQYSRAHNLSKLGRLIACEWLQ